MDTSSHITICNLKQDLLTIRNGILCTMHLHLLLNWQLAFPVMVGLFAASVEMYREPFLDFLILDCLAQLHNSCKQLNWPRHQEFLTGAIPVNTKNQLPCPVTLNCPRHQEFLTVVIHVNTKDTIIPLLSVMCFFT